MEDFKLIAVQCPSCSSGLTVEVNDNIVYCSSCGNGYEIINDKLEPIDINFAHPVVTGQGDVVYKPFWLVKTNVNIISRDASGGWISNLFGSSGKNSGNITFYVPAFWMDIESMSKLGTNFTQKNPVASPQKYNVPLTGFVYTKDDAKKMCDFILLTMEGEKSDTIKNIDYRIEVKSMEILGVPFYKQPNGRMRDAVLGIELNI
jgi:hypothetical protein